MDNILPIYIAFFGPIVFVVVFEVLNWTKMNTAARFTLPVLIYVVSVVTGAGTGVFLNQGNVSSAQIAGIYAPLIITTVLTFLFWLGPYRSVSIFRKRTDDWLEDDDEFLDDFDD